MICRYPLRKGLVWLLEDLAETKKKFYIYSDGSHTHTHTCSEWSLRILKWNVPYVQKQHSHLKDWTWFPKRSLMLVLNVGWRGSVGEKNQLVDVAVLGLAACNEWYKSRYKLDWIGKSAPAPLHSNLGFRPECKRKSKAEVLQFYICSDVSHTHAHNKKWSHQWPESLIIGETKLSNLCRFKMEKIAGTSSWPSWIQYPISLVSSLDTVPVKCRAPCEV